MDVLRPLRAGLFFYECLRLLLLLAFSLTAPLEDSVNGAFFPCLVYVSSNALFPLAALFVWLKPEEHRNYLTLYMAGKIIGIVSFCVWEFFFSGGFSEPENGLNGIILLGGGALLSFADILSVWGAWVLANKFRQVLVRQPEPSGKTERGGI